MTLFWFIYQWQAEYFSTWAFSGDLSGLIHLIALLSSLNDKAINTIQKYNKTRCGITELQYNKVWHYLLH